MKQPILFNALAITLRCACSAVFTRPILDCPICQEACNDLVDSSLMEKKIVFLKD
jgi:hypothetical protein